MQPKLSHLQLALQALAAGHIPEAELQTRLEMTFGTRNAAVMNCIGQIALRLDDDAVAAHWFRRAIETEPSFKPARKNLDALLARPPRPARQGDRFVFIKAWSAGFFSEIDHLLAWLLFAECTGRRPIIDWGDGFLFSNDTSRSAFPSYFEPVGDGVERALRPGLSLFPPRWTRENLLAEDHHKTLRPRETHSPFGLWNRPEDVVVADCHARPIDLLNWIPPAHPAHGLPLEGLYQYAVAKYLRPIAEVQGAVDAFATSQFADRRVLAVHVRGSDKHTEDSALAQTLRQYPALVEAQAARVGSAAIFLMSDSEPMLREYRARFTKPVIVTSVARTSNDLGTHFLSHSSRLALGREVLIDALLALRCHGFVGVGSSNVSGFIRCARAWPEGTAVLAGPVLYEQHSIAWRMRGYGTAKPAKM